MICVEVQLQPGELKEKLRRFLTRRSDQCVLRSVGQIQERVMSHVIMTSMRYLIKVAASDNDNKDNSFEYPPD